MKLSGIITVPIHIGDFLTGTMHMDTLEKGAYVMLIFAHYQTGETGLPNDDRKLSRIAGVTLKVWSRIRDTLAEKFDTTGDFWVHDKVIDTLRKVHEKSSSQRDKALKKHNRESATAQPRHSQPKPKPNIIDTNVSIISDLEYEMYFMRFWESYFGQGASGVGAAHKGSRQGAFKIFLKLAKKEKDVEQFTQTLIDGANRYAEHLKRSGSYSKHATTWLNAEGWKDDYSSQTTHRPQPGFGQRTGASTLGEVLDAAEKAKEIINRRG